MGHHLTQAVHGNIGEHFRRLNLEKKDVKIDGEFLSNLRFADDIIHMHRNTARTTTYATRTIR